MSAQVELTVLFVFWRLFLALAIADSFALARPMGVADSPWLGLHRISHSDDVPFMPDENNERKQLTGKRLVFHRNTKTNTKTTTKTTRKRYCERGYCQESAPTSLT
ncbi:hypothetical protein M405DRAFT_843704, partial [Rhizopogon salebrosus TDB-379]